MNIPIIRLEIESMRQSILMGFTQQMVELDSMVKIAVEKACSQENIQYILDEASNKYIKEALDEELKNYFIRGRGRKILAEKVAEKLKDTLEY